MLAILIFGLMLSAAWAQTENVLYNFCAQNGCTDGANPAGVVFDRKGDLYGTTQTGGAHELGVVFKLTPSNKETVLYSFCSQGRFPNCTDGSTPVAGVVFDQKGNLYGTTPSGGANRDISCGSDGCGVAFKLTPKGKYSVLYNFCAHNGQNDCTDGGVPWAGLILDQKGNLYGTTRTGGAHTDGIVFRLASSGKETVLYSFCSKGGFNCTDGEIPFAPVVFDKKGNLYGTTVGGGAYVYGVVFKLTPAGKETTLHNFCAQNGCPDGAVPYAGVVFDEKGNLYGTATQGGMYGGGVVFKITPAGKYTVLYNFCANGGRNCTDGAYPVAPMAFDHKGNLYGTTENGGTHHGGVLFKITPAGQYSLLYSFCANGAPNCTDGVNPNAGLVLDQNGNLYGTAGGGANWPGMGVVFKITP